MEQLNLFTALTVGETDEFGNELDYFDEYPDEDPFDSIEKTEIAFERIVGAYLKHHKLENLLRHLAEII